MGILRKIISMILLLASLTALIGICVITPEIFQPIAQSFQPFSFENFVLALYGLLVGVLGFPLVLLILGIIGFTIPRPIKPIKK